MEEDRGPKKLDRQQYQSIEGKRGIGAERKSIEWVQ